MFFVEHAWNVRAKSSCAKIKKENARRLSLCGEYYLLVCVCVIFCLVPQPADWCCSLASLLARREVLCPCLCVIIQCARRQGVWDPGGNAKY